MYRDAVATAAEAFRLARVLRELALAVAVDDGEAPSLPLVLITDDIAHHAGTTVSEVAARTGFAQSLVSRTVADLRAGDIVQARPDPADGRRTLITVTDRARSETFAERGGRQLADAIRERYPELRESRAVALERLVDRLVASLPR